MLAPLNPVVARLTSGHVGSFAPQYQTFEKLIADPNSEPLGFVASTSWAIIYLYPKTYPVLRAIDAQDVFKLSPLRGRPR